MLDAPRIIVERAVELLTERLHADAGPRDRISPAFGESLIRGFEHDIFGMSFQAITVPSTTVPAVSITRLLLKYPDSPSSARDLITLSRWVRPITTMFIGGSWADHERFNFAENLALLNAEESLYSIPSDRRGASACYETAATLAPLRAKNLFRWMVPSNRIASDLDLNRAIAHLGMAESLADWQRNPADLARIETKLAVIFQ